MLVQSAGGEVGIIEEFSEFSKYFFHCFEAHYILTRTVIILRLT